MLPNSHSADIKNKPILRDWIFSLLLLVIGVIFVVLVIDEDHKVFAIGYPSNFIFIFAYRTLSIFFLAYGIARIVFGQAWPREFHVFIAVTVLVVSIVFALLIVNASVKETNVLQILLYIFLPLLALLPTLLYISFLSTKTTHLLAELKLNLHRIYYKNDPSFNEIERIYAAKFKQIFGGDHILPDFQSLLPMVLTTILMSLGWLYIATKVMTDIINGKGESITLDPVNYGFIGVYLFALNFLFRRYVQSDLGPVAYSNVNLRLITTFIWTMLLWNFADIANVKILAFTVGIFPNIAWQWLLKQLQAITEIGSSEPSKNYPLRQIDGITIWGENRLLEEDIENVHNLVTANLPELLLKTNYSPGCLIDWIDQAILLTHLSECQNSTEDNKTAITTELNGITTASGFLTYYYNCYNNCPTKDASGRLERLASEIEKEANLYHINVWHATHRSPLPEKLSFQKCDATTVALLD